MKQRNGEIIMKFRFVATYTYSHLMRGFSNVVDYDDFFYIAK